jgi:DNA-binding XRE family transcriptional regulator
MKGSKQQGSPSRWTTAIDGDLLRRMRRQRGLSQERLAGLAGVSLTTVARLERPSMQPCRTWTLYRLANALERHPGPPPAGPSLRVTGPAPGAGQTGDPRR